MAITAILKRLGLSGLAKGQGDQGPPQRPSIGKDVLEREGILANLQDPAQACRRARGLIHQGHLTDARGVLLPHVDTEDPTVAGTVAELLAMCAAAGVGGCWSELCQTAQVAYERGGDAAAAARIQRFRGEMLTTAGQFCEADTVLAGAVGSLEAVGDISGAAVARALRGRVLLRTGCIAKARESLQAVIPLLTGKNQHRAEALARLDLALVHAWLADDTEVARELLRADACIAAAPGPNDRLRLQLTRAETLIILGEYERGARGLQQLARRVHEVESLEVQARLWLLLGQAVERDDVKEARMHFTRSRRLYETLGYRNQVARCEIGLARLDAGKGRESNERMQSLLRQSFDQWPLLQAELRLLRAEVGYIHRGGDPDPAANRELFDARAFGEAMGNVRLVQRADIALLRRGAAVSGLRGSEPPVVGPEFFPPPPVHDGRTIAVPGLVEIMQTRLFAPSSGPEGARTTLEDQTAHAAAWAPAEYLAGTTVCDT